MKEIITYRKQDARRLKKVIEAYCRARSLPIAETVRIYQGERQVLVSDQLLGWQTLENLIGKVQDRIKVVREYDYRR